MNTLTTSNLSKIAINKSRISLINYDESEDYISRKVVKGLMIKYGFKAPDMTVTEFVEDCLPSVQPTRPTGKWIDIQYFKADDTYYRPKCPFCSIEPKEYSNFCPNCGARMAESEGDK